MGIEDAIAARGGTARTVELLQLGHTSHQLTEAVRSGAIVRVRQGHYALPDTDALRIAAQRVGGRLAGLWALRAHGVWTPRGAFTMAVTVSPHASRLRSPSDRRRRVSAAECEIHWDDTSAGLGGLEPEPVARAIERLAGQLPPAMLFACFESALHQGLLTRPEAERLRARFVRTVSRLFGHADSASESGAESLLKFLILEEGVDVRQQVPLPGVGEVDFVLGERQIAEADGAGYHSGPKEFERDRLRHAVASVLGYRTLRFSARLIEDRPELVRAAVRAALARGDHLAG